MTKEQLTTRVLALRKDGLSFRAIEGKLLKAFNLKEAGNGFKAFRIVQAATAKKKPAAAKKSAAKKPVVAKAVKVAKVAKVTKNAAAAATVQA